MSRLLQYLLRVSLGMSCLSLFAPPLAAQDQPPLRLVPHTITLSNGKHFDLNVPGGFDISVAAEGLKRVRFMAKAPDGRIFATDMYNLADNSNGTIYILDGFDAKTGKFARVKPYLQHLRNPNN